MLHLVATTKHHSLTNILASRRLARAPTPLIATLIRRDLSRPRTSREDIWTTSLADVVEVARQARASIRVFAFTVDVAGGDVSVSMATNKTLRGVLLGRLTSRKRTGCYRLGGARRRGR
jgi:hypothetical protein